MEARAWCLIFALNLYFASVFAVCPECLCPPDFSAICARQVNGTKLRGFSSSCVMDCTNNCRKIKYEFAFKGRCKRGREAAKRLKIGKPISNNTIIQDP